MSYYDDLLEKIPKIKKILDNDTNYIIYHYTKPEKLLNILQCGALRFSNALYLNDKEEIAYSYRLIVHLIDEFDGLNPDLFDKIKTHFRNKYKHIVDGDNDFVNKLEYFTTSFSTESDNLTLWNNYAKGKNYTGYNIGFDKKKLVNEMTENNYLPIYGSVIYDKAKQVKIIHAIFKKWNMLFERALRCKNVFGVDNSKPTGVVEKNGLFVPYLEYKFSKDAVSSINIGPTFEENIFYTSTNRMLLNFGYFDKEVYRSKIPLRY